MSFHTRAVCFAQELLNRIEDFQQHSEAVLSAPLTAECVCELEGLLEASAQLDVALPELPCLRSRLEQARWLREVQQAHAHTHTHTHSPPAAHTHARARGLTLDAMRRLIDQGVGLSPNPALERAMARLQELLTVSETWEEKAHSLLRDRSALITPVGTLTDESDYHTCCNTHRPVCLPHLLEHSQTSLITTPVGTLIDQSAYQSAYHTCWNTHRPVSAYYTCYNTHRPVCLPHLMEHSQTSLLTSLLTTPVIKCHVSVFSARCSAPSEIVKG